MSTQFVVTDCCTAPVVLSEPDTISLTASAICSRCRTEVGRPGVEDGPDVSAFVAFAARLRYRLSAELRAELLAQLHRPTAFVRITGV